MRECVRHLGVADSLDPFLGQVRRKPGLPIPTLKPCPFLSRHHDEGIAAMLRNDDRLMPGFVAKRAESLLKLAGRDFRNLHGKISNLAIISNLPNIFKDNMYLLNQPQYALFVAAIILPINIPGGCGGLQTPAHLFFIKNLRAIARSDPP
jgi:hypothetical protein